MSQAVFLEQANDPMDDRVVQPGIERRGNPVVAQFENVCAIQLQ